MKKWAISYIVAFIVLLSVCAGEESIRGFRAVDPVDLETKVPRGYGQVFVEAGRENNIDPVFLAAISAHESGQWKSRIARRKNNWMGLMSRRGPKSFGTPQESIFYTAKLLNRKPFQGRNTLSEIAPIYCTKNPKYWESSVLHWKHELQEWQTAAIEREITFRLVPIPVVSQVKLFLSLIKDLRTIDHLTGS
jgi:Mannosyl-glycoprotein endo-beta-N-acetylglucosaminidase